MDAAVNSSRSLTERWMISCFRFHSVMSLNTLTLPVTIPPFRM